MPWWPWLVSFFSDQGTFCSITQIPKLGRMTLNRKINERQCQHTFLMASEQCYWLQLLRAVCFSLPWKTKSRLIVFIRLWKWRDRCISLGLRAPHMSSTPQGSTRHGEKEDLHVPAPWRQCPFFPLPHLQRGGSAVDFRLANILVEMCLLNLKKNIDQRCHLKSFLQRNYKLNIHWKVS